MRCLYFLNFHLGHIDRNEMTLLFQDMHERIDRKKFDELVSMIDKNNDGRIGSFS